MRGRLRRGMIEVLRRAETRETSRCNCTLIFHLMMNLFPNGLHFIIAKAISERKDLWRSGDCFIKGYAAVQKPVSCITHRRIHKWTSFAYTQFLVSQANFSLLYCWSTFFPHRHSRHCSQMQFIPVKNEVLLDAWLIARRSKKNERKSVFHNSFLDFAFHNRIAG